jgi:hypothetical protein
MVTHTLFILPFVTFMMNLASSLVCLAMVIWQATFALCLCCTRSVRNATVDVVCSIPALFFIFPPLLVVSDWMQHAHVFSKLLCGLGLVLHHLTTDMMFLVFAIQACLWCRTQIGAVTTVYSCKGMRSWSRASFIYFVGVLAHVPI